MSATSQETSLGLNCPNCGGIVPVPEGQVIVKCPYCDMRSMVRGERGMRRYHIPLVIMRRQAIDAMKRFFKSRQAIARDVSQRARLESAFVAYLPFWSSWARVLGWVFGQKRVQHGDDTRYEPREIRFARELNWTGAACDVGEFGVETVSLSEKPLESFDPIALHAQAMVFEPIGSTSTAQSAAQENFITRLKSTARLDRVSQVFVRFVQRRFGLVYYPLWVLRYLYRGRAFQVVVDGFSGQVLYGKAPGNTLYRAAVLVGGMALGAFLAVDISALAFTLAANTRGDSSGALLIGGVIVIGIGFGIIAAAYRSFRYGEQYEYRAQVGDAAQGFLKGAKFNFQVEDLETWINQLS